MNIIDEAGHLNAEINAKKKNLESLKSKIKALPDDELVGDNFKAVITTRVTKSFNEDLLLQKVKEAGALWLIKETVDLDKLEDSIAMNEIDGSLFIDCIVSKETKALAFKKVGK